MDSIRLQFYKGMAISSKKELAASHHQMNIYVKFIDEADSAINAKQLLIESLLKNHYK
jgi:hypothetical protein